MPLLERYHPVVGRYNIRIPDPAAEYEAVRHRVGLIDRSDLGVVEVTGRDRASFLHAMLSNDVKSPSAGRGATAAFVNVQDKVQTLVTIWALEDRLVLLTPRGEGAKTIQALDHSLFSEKAYFKDVTGEMALLMLAGPEAIALAERLAGVTVPETAWGNVDARVADVDVRLVRGGTETGEAEVWVAAATADGERLRAALVESGAMPIGRAAWESLRIEAGTPTYGSDVDTTLLLPEIPIEHLVSHTKGCYIGQEVVVRIRDPGSHVANRLANETSPYLLQHAHNPVDWFPWGDEAFAKAKSEDKPILLSVGYSACHWCHVMERESFEDQDVARLMNQHFVSVKVDREERPDVDHIYMQAVQAMTGHVGWPMTVFLTPEGPPFYGGPHFPPTPPHGLPSFSQLLNAIADAWSTRPAEVLAS